MANAPEIESPVHPIENGSAQKQRQNNPRRIAQSLFHAHKGTTFCRTVSKKYPKFD